MSNDSLVFAPLGGVGEIGMNFGLYGFGPKDNRQWIVVDCGIGFASEEDLPGVDIILPDISFIEEERHNLLGILITHAHEDHYGGLPELWERLEAPVFATPFASAMLQSKLSGSRDGKLISIPVQEVNAGDTIELGPFSVEFVGMAHSIPEPCALAITTALGTVVHTGDWKVDPDPVVGPPMDEARLKAIGDAGCRAIICDSTNAMRDGVSPSESDVAKALTELINDAPQRVAVTCFASNLARIRTIAEAAAACDRDVVVVGRAMHRVIGVGRELGLLGDTARFVEDSHYGYLPRDKTVLLCTGTQGEPRAALTRIAQGKHPTVTLQKGDRVIYSARIIPGNDREVGNVLNGLIVQGVEVITDRDHLIHVSGHPRRDELRHLYGLLKPQVSVPVHGEPMHLRAHAELARELGVQEVCEIYNGDVVQLLPAPSSKIDELRSGRWFKDGKLLLSESDNAIRERRKLAFAGIICLSVAVDPAGELAGDMEIEAFGIPDRTSGTSDMIDDALDAAEDAFDQMTRKQRRSMSKLQDRLERALRNAIDANWGKRPIVHVSIVEVD